MKPSAGIGRHYPPIGIYEHYKSTPEYPRYYQVIGFARHTEREELLVMYVPLYYYASAHPGVPFYARPLDMFGENVVVDGESVPRFRYIGVEL